MPDIISQQRTGFEAKGQCLDHLFVCLCGSFVYEDISPPKYTYYYE